MHISKQRRKGRYAALRPSRTRVLMVSCAIHGLIFAFPIQKSGNIANCTLQKYGFFVNQDDYLPARLRRGFINMYTTC